MDWISGDDGSKPGDAALVKKVVVRFADALCLADTVLTLEPTGEIVIVPFTLVRTNDVSGKAAEFKVVVESEAEDGSIP